MQLSRAKPGNPASNNIIPNITCVSLLWPHTAIVHDFSYFGMYAIKYLLRLYLPPIGNAILITLLTNN